MQSFLVLFYLLDMCYDMFPENDLGAFLGMISPELWEDGRSIDISIYNDWKRMFTGGVLAESDIVNAAHSFLEEYESKYGFNFTQSKGILLRVADAKTLEKAFLYADKMNLKHKYYDFASDLSLNSNV